jgi:UDP-N-acetyl-D-mannosaminuronic acid dehydrogenase
MTKLFDFKNSNVIGLGYIGLPTSVVMARAGLKVTGIDINKATIEAVNAKRCPIEEPELPEVLAEMVGKGLFSADTKPTKSDVFLIAVPTPFTGGYKPDLSYVEAATQSIAPILEKGNLIIVESTIPVGTTEMVGRWIEALRPDLVCARRGATSMPDIFIAHCPERVLPGQMLKELVENDRVIGGLDAASTEAGRAFYRSFVTGNCLGTDSRTAELCKLAENSFRDINIAFANEMAEICEDFDIDVWELISLANQHPRVNILKPGPGVGGHCIAVDPWFIVASLGDKARLIREARWINSGRPRQVVRKVLETVSAGGVNSIGCFGLSYKPDVDDYRESPAIEIMEYLSKELQLVGASIDFRVVEPYTSELPHELKQARSVRLVTIDDALDADLLLMLVDHRAFHEIPASRRLGKKIIDTRGIWR